MTSQPDGPSAASQPAGTTDAVLIAAFNAHQQGDLAKAETGYTRILADKPDHPDALHLLGLILKSRGELERAEQLIRRSIAVRPEVASPHYNLGNLLLERGQRPAALDSFRTALARQPNYPEAHYALGNMLRDDDQYAEAIAAFGQALAQRPDYFEARHNRANILRETGRALESIAELRAVIAASPELPEAHYNLALSLFTLGRYVEGGPEYEWRWKTKGFTSPRRSFNRPVWEGTAIPNKTLLIYAEQGLGDTLQFIRYARLVRPRVGQLIVEVPPRLHRLISLSLGDLAYVVKQGQPLPPFDRHAAMMSLPWLCATNPDSVPAVVPYLQTEPDRVLRWREILMARPGLRVGINWQGNPDAKIDRGRSLPLRLLAPLASVPGLRLISLQKNAGTEQLADLPTGMTVESLGEDYDSGADAFMDAAAVMMNLDVIVTTDTALAHLAGALARPTCLLLKKVPDWRWGLSGELTHWYPTQKLFRQQVAGDWDSPIAALVKTLAAWQSERTNQGG
jgi:Flp pilus assembly protein TadD